MTTSPTTAIRIDPELKVAAKAIFDDLGISMSTAVNAYLKAVVREKGIPFEMRLPTSPANPKPGNMSLNRANAAKSDEFYTQYEDVAKEMANHSFAGHSVLCNCDDPFESAFVRFFITHFNALGLTRLTATCYAGSPIANHSFQLLGKPGAYKAVVRSIPNVSPVRSDGTLDVEKLCSMPGNSVESLDGDGDFRSKECESLLDDSDIIVTNPPFSLFREYIAQLQHHGKRFIILGNINASTCKGIFPLFRDDKVWYGESIRSGDRKFYVPSDYPLNASGCGVDDQGRRFIRVKGVRWFTNMDVKRRHEPVSLEQDYDPKIYPRYENYRAIDVGRTSRIPRNWPGVMGVPITFLDKYDPEQFEIIMLANGNARTSVEAQTLDRVGYVHHPQDKGGVGIINGNRVYARILIRKRRA